jgi:hypothetical protein
MKARTTASGILSALALALPASASAQEEGAVVPPENSAATQYTEAVPTAGGDKQTGKGHKPPPSEVLGSKNAHELQSQGKDGKAVARVVAETAPETESGSGSAASTTPPRGSGNPQNGERASGKSQGGAGNGGEDQAKSESPTRQPATTQPASEPLPDGSSALGQVIGEATGSSSTGGIGLLLPLAIVAALAWALAYLWQQRRPAE